MLSLNTVTPYTADYSPTNGIDAQSEVSNFAELRAALAESESKLVKSMCERESLLSSIHMVQDAVRECKLGPALPSQTAKNETGRALADQVYQMVQALAEHKDKADAAQALSKREFDWD